MKQDPRSALSMAPRPGRATAICTRNRVAFIDQPDSVELFELMSQPGLVWEDLVRNLARRIVGSSYDYPAVAVFEATSHGATCFLYGELNVEVLTSEGETDLPVADISTWFESQLPGRLQRVEIGETASEPIGQISNGFLASDGLVAGFDNEAFVHETPDLGSVEDGTIEGSPDESFDPALTTMVTSEELKALKTELEPDPEPEPELEPDPEPAPEPEPEPEPEPAAFDPTQTTMISGTALSNIKKDARNSDPQRPSEPGKSGDPDFTLPQLRGVRCPSGHLNSLQDSRCRTCGESVDRTGAIEADERPALAIITFDDGTQMELSTPMVLGRSVPEPYSIRGETARTVSLTDETNLISRVHLEIHFSGWDIELIDKGSANGSFTHPLESSTTKTRLHTGQPTAIPLGTAVEIGGRSFSVTAGPQDS